MQSHSQSIRMNERMTISRHEAEWEKLAASRGSFQGADSFSSYVLSTCSPSHVRSARMGVDWRPVLDVPGRFLSFPGNIVHDCRPGLPCDAWICRFKDGAKICAISGRYLASPGDISPRKRALYNDEGDAGKRHQDRPLPDSSADLIEMQTDSMDIDTSHGLTDVSLRSYNPRPPPPPATHEDNAVMWGGRPWGLPQN